MKGYDVCKECGQKIDTKKIEYFELISNMKKDFELKYGENATHLVVGVEDYYNLENSDDLLDRLIRIVDTSNGVVRDTLCGLKVIKSQDFEGISVAKL